MLKKWVLAAALLLLAAGCGSEKSAPVNGSDSDDEKQKAGGLEVSGEAAPGEDAVAFTITIANKGDNESDIEFTSGQKFEIIVTDSAGNEVYRYSDGRMFTQALETITLKPGESKSWSDEWKTEQAAAGEYEAALTVTASKVDGEEAEPEKLTVVKMFTLEQP
ncbi:BsuPI-related putative proteinase inhibitor [Bacillus marinisedimentorum]|uniref:BsuPI-related putative proteinase inhibitor n=1 Tax=Bacillus marinisedimentorum TaxID=1821260 RepID=UPI0009F3933D|nr:BsuPI-related putative proteinase inhibitor [Bacillus marinisedimentorum]